MRNLYRYSQKTKDWFTIIAGAVLTAIGIATLALLAIILTGCAGLGYEQYGAGAAAARGCYCSGTDCTELKSAAGQAAVAAAGGQVVNITKVEKPRQ